MTDENHTWNSGKPLRARKQRCGCHITSKTFTLCMEGAEFKKSADSRYALWQAEKDKAIDAVIKRAHQKCFETHRDAYLKHLKTGKTWVL